MRVSKFLRVEYTRLYDIANLNRKVKGYKVSYSKRKVPETFFCQNCRKFNKTGGVFHKDKKRGKLRLCDEVCKSEIINKLKGFDNEQ